MKKSLFVSAALLVALSMLATTASFAQETGVPERGLPAPKGMIVEGNGVPEASPPTKRCSQEAKVCPNGRTVGRTGPNCEFAACPAEVKKVYPRDHPPSFDCDTVPSKKGTGECPVTAKIVVVCTITTGKMVDGKFVTNKIQVPKSESATHYEKLEDGKPQFNLLMMFCPADLN